MKCLFLDQYAKIGGGQAILLNILHVAMEEGHEVTAMFPGGDELERKVRSLYGEKIRIIPIRELNLTPGRKGLLDTLKMLLYTLYFLRFLYLFRRQELIYVNGPRLYFPAFLLSQWMHRRFLYHVHLVHPRTELRLLARILESERTDSVILNSQYAYEQFIASEPAAATNPKLWIIENSLSPAYSKLSFEDRFQQPGKLNAAVIGRISPEKGQDILLELAPKLPDIDFYVIGDPDFAGREFLERLKRNSIPNILYYGKTENLEGTIRAIPIHISLVPSRWPEPFGLVAIESMAMSCITILSGTGELKNIALRTSALVYDCPENLELLLLWLRSADPAELVAVVHKQFTAVMENYSFEMFRQKISGLLK